MKVRIQPLFAASAAGATLMILAACGSGTSDASGGTVREEAGATGDPVEGLPASIAEAGEIRFGWAALSGYSTSDPGSGEVQGFYVDVAREVAEDLGVDLVLQEDTWPTIVLGLEANKYDFTFVGNTEERAAQADFTNDIIESDFTLAVKQDAPFTGLEDVDAPGNTIAVTTGSNTDEALTPLVENADILRVRDVGGVIMSVQNDRAEAMAGVRDYLIVSLEGYPDLTVLDSAWGVSVQGMVVDQGNEELLALLNESVERMKADGTIQQLIEEHGLEGVEVSD